MDVCRFAGSISARFSKLHDLLSPRSECALYNLSCKTFSVVKQEVSYCKVLKKTGDDGQRLFFQHVVPDDRYDFCADYQSVSLLWSQVFDFHILVSLLFLWGNINKYSQLLITICLG